MMMTSLSFNKSHEVIVHFILMKLLFPNIDIFSRNLFQLLFFRFFRRPRFCRRCWWCLSCLSCRWWCPLVLRKKDLQRMTSCLEPRHTIRARITGETETNLVCRRSGMAVEKKIYPWVWAVERIFFPKAIPDHLLTELSIFTLQLCLFTYES